MTDPEARWKQFADLGPEKVRQNLASHVYGEDNSRQALAWLEHQESLRASSENAATLAEARTANELARAANELANSANEAAREANTLASAANETAERVASTAQTTNMIAALALIASAIAIIVSIIGLFLKR